MKKGIYLFFLSAISLLSGTFEHYQLYKDIHVLRMGGAQVGLGGSGTSIFYNPAGLSQMDRSKGAEVRILNLSASINQNGIDLIEDAQDVQDKKSKEERNLAVIRVIRKHLGENNHIEASDFSYFAKGIKNYNFVVGGLANVNLDFRTHRGFGSDGVLDTQGLIVGGGVFGLSYIKSPKLSFGGGIKYLKYVTINRQFTIGELITHKNDIDTYILDDVAKDGSDMVFDLGAIYKFRKNYQVGFSGINLGGIGNSSEPTYIPGTFNIGLGYTKDFKYKYLKAIRAGFDITDLTDEYSTPDFVRKFKTGLDATILDTKFLTLKGGLGLYQGSYTAGLNLRMAIVELSFTTYSEELGAYAGQDRDRRYLLNLTIGW
ncbi:MAG TPA: hypothetical protein EYO61_05490 [Campylobacterales bacterium]|nr:hypothetical protein [Campylobacterales bacterium]HIO71163.1 hypothetical protein [Campylobacterales bacterium]